MPRVIEELERTAPTLEQDYPETLAAELRKAITEADLFVSYNLAAKAERRCLPCCPRRRAMSPPAAPGGALRARRTLPASR